MEAFELALEEISMWTSEMERSAINTLNNWKMGERKNRHEYHLYEKYAVKCFAGVERIVVKKSDCVMATTENVFMIIKNVHESCGHKGDRKTHQKICESHANIPRKLVSQYIRQCERCIEKLRKKEKRGLVIRPIIAKDFNDRGQVDLVDYQSLPDGPYRFIMHYQDHLTKYHLIRPLCNKTAAAVAQQLMQIFVDFGAPQILQSDNGREFTANIIKVNIYVAYYHYYSG